MVELLGRMNAAGLELSAVRVSPEALAGLIRLIESGTITGPTAKQLFERLFEEGGDPRAMVEREGLGRVADERTIDTLVRDTLAAHAKPVQQYREGKSQAFGFLVGQVMKASHGKADPEKVSAAVRRYLESADK
jgi:aspartyl-tRNA(Asn)/glutamyl-tRNA(Gln) amidotransferase subunit B